MYLPAQYLSLVFASWLWSDGGWVRTDFIDKLGLMVTVGGIGGIAINTAHELGHKRAQVEKWLSRVALAQTWYGHFFVEHNRGHHVRVATADDPASARMGESLYSFIRRSVVGSLRSAWTIVGRCLARKGKRRWTIENNVLNAWLMSFALFIAIYCVGCLVRLRCPAVAGRAGGYRLLHAGSRQLPRALWTPATEAARRTLRTGASFA